MARKQKRWLLGVTILLAALVFCFVQNNYLTVTCYTYENALIPKCFEGYRIVQISDLHNAVFGAKNKHLLDRLKELEPDMIVLTGDLVDSNHTNLDVAIAFARQCVEIAPAYYITGNHENWLDASQKEFLLAELEKLGVQCLKDEFVEITKEDASLTLIGLNDESLTGNTLRKVLEKTKEGQLQILLAHEPQYLEEYAENGVDIVFSGHAHGGQVRLPFLGGLVAPDQGFFPKYTEEMHVMGDTTMIISRGLGNSIIPLRMFNLPEIVCVELKGKSDNASY